MKYKIVGIGEILWDIYGSEKYLGGATANFAFHSHTLGNEGIIVSRVGNDKLGREIISAVKERGLTTYFIRKDGHYPTGTVQIKILPDSEPKFICSKNVAFDYMQTDKNLKSLSENADAVLFGTLAQRNETSRKTIISFLKLLKKAVIIYDVNFRGFRKNYISIVENSLQLADVLKLNNSEFRKIKKLFNGENEDDTSFLYRILNDFNLKLICLTFGKWGCLVLDKDEKYYSPGIKIKTVDTVGSGDAFLAALVSEYLKGKQLKEIAEFSNYVGALIASRKGATPNYSEEELNAFINAHKKRNIKKSIVQKYCKNQISI